MKFLIAILTVFFAFSNAEAAFREKLEIETRVQEKLQRMLAPFDAKAVVEVHVKLRSMNLQLPGTRLGLNDFIPPKSSISTLNFEDVENVAVNIMTPHELPEDLQQTLINSLDIPSSRKRFNFEVMSAEMVGMVTDQNTENKRAIAALERISDLDHTLASFRGVFNGLLNKIFFALIGLMFASVIASQLHRMGIGKALTSAAEMVASAAGAGRAAQSASGGGNEPLSLKDIFRDESLASLPTDSVLAIISDCYWCEEDGYAAWVWDRLSVEQRKAVLAQWPMAQPYIASLASTVACPKKYHSHPYYLQSVDFSQISQKDLLTWLQQNSSGWHWISPLRQASMELSLVDKLNLQKTTPSDSLPTLPSPSREMRELEPRVEIETITERDETAIFQNPTLVPRAIRRKVPSLVWLALLRKADREAVLAPVMAKDLAEIWLGPTEILEKVKEGLSDRKLKLVESYLQKLEPRRDTQTMMYLVNQSVAMLENRSTEEMPSEAASPQETAQAA